MGVTPARKKRRMGGRGCLMSARPWGVSTHSYRSATPSFIRVRRGIPPFVGGSTRSIRPGAGTKEVVPPHAKRGGGGVPGFTKVGRERGCPRSRVDLRSPQPITESIGPINFFAVREVGGVTDFLEVGVTPGLFPGIVRSRPEIFKEKSGWLYVTSCRALETNPEDGGCRPHNPTSEECRRPRRGAPAAEQGGINRTCPARARQAPERLPVSAGRGKNRIDGSPFLDLNKRNLTLMIFASEGNVTKQLLKVLYWNRTISKDLINMDGYY